jgi:hypothetical protein
MVAKRPGRKPIDYERKNVPHNVRAQVLHESGYRCANPNCRMIITIDVHHLLPVSRRGKDVAENLLPLCGVCHDLHHRGEITDRSTRAWKFLLLALNEAFDRRSIDILLTLGRLEFIKRLNGEGVIRLAALVSANLVNVREYFEYTSGSAPQKATMQYLAELTPKGKLFVEGWKNGDQSAAIRGLPGDLSGTGDSL